MPSVDSTLRAPLLVPLLALALVGCAAAAAQEDAADGAAAGGAEGGAAADVLSPYEVPSAAQRATTELARIRARVHHVRDLEHHVVVIERLGRRVSRLRVDSDLDTLGTEPRRELRNLHEQWAELDTKLSETGEALEATSSELEGEAERLRALTARWERTAVAAVGSDYPETTRRQVAEVVATAETVESELEAHLERVLAAQATLADHAIDTGDVLAEIDRAIEASRLRLFTRTHPPGLGALPGVEPPPLSEQLQHAAIHHAHALDRFATQLGPRAYLHGVLVLGFLALLYWLRRQHDSARMGDAPIRAFEHPILLTILVALLLVRPLHPLAPRAVVELSQLLAIGPLLSIPLPMRWRPVTRLVITLYVLDWARLSLEEHGVEHRVALTAIAAFATVAFAWCARRSEGPARPAWGVASLATAVGLAADLVGFVPFSALLVEGVIASAFFSVVLVAFHRVVMGTTDAALSTAAARGTVLGRHAAVTRQAVRRGSQIGLGLSWGWITLDYFQLRNAFVTHAGRVMAESVQLGDLEISLGDVVAFVLGIWAAVLVSRVLAKTLQEDVAPRMGMGPGVPAAAALVVRYAVLALGFVLAASAAGIGLAQLSLFAGALGVGVGFGLQNIVANFVAGLLLVFERPIKVGDTVDVAGHRGVVREIGIRASTIRVLSGADIVIPNSKLTESELINWTHTDSTLRVDVPIGVAYGSDLRVVRDALLRAASTLELALDSPPPSVIMIGFGDSSIDFHVRIWIAEAPDQPAAQSALALAIHDALAEAGVEIPFPQRDVHLRTES